MALVPYNNRSLKRAYDGGNYPMAMFKRPRPAYSQNTISRAPRNYYPRSRRYRTSSAYRLMSISSPHQNPVYPRPEAKYSDINQAGNVPPVPAVPSVITSAGGVLCLNASIAQGTGQRDRIGITICCKSLAYRYELDLPATPANQVPTSGRVIILWDKQPNGATAVISEVLANASYLSYLNLIFKDRFTVLRNEQFALSPNGDQVLFREGYIKLNQNSQYSTSTANIPASGALLLLIIGDQATAANQPTITGTFRLRFYDC